MSKITDINRWRCEIELAIRFREDEFGSYTRQKKTKAGEHIDYFEKGFSDQMGMADTEDMLTTLNIIDSIVSIIVPSLYFQNPKTIALPAKVESEKTAPIVGKTVDHYRNKLAVEEINQRIIWDAYVLGYGVGMVGYATKFGKDIRDEKNEKRAKRKNVIDSALKVLNLKDKDPQEVTHPEIDLKIISENPYVSYINPFDFMVDPRATSLNNAMWWGHSVRKTVKAMKSNPKYKNTEHLSGMDPDIRSLDMSKVSEPELEAFETVQLYELHYINEDKFYTLVISQDGSDEWREHYHDESIYDMDEWQADMLTFKKHGHHLFPRSDIAKIKNLQDEITRTVDSILEQVNKFVPKLSVEDTGLTPEGKNNLENGGVGALVWTTGKPADVIKELNFTQLKADLTALIDQLIGLISMQTGLTRAQLTGLSDANTATEATLEQGGQNIRLSDMEQSVTKFVNRQSRKLWKVIRQFVDLTELNLINGIKGIDEETGLPEYDWLTINDSQKQEMINGEYDFQIEVGSTQKTTLAVVRKAFENWFNILAKTEVIAIMQAQGWKFDIAEFAKKGMDAFPELGIDSGKIIQKIVPGGTQGLLPDSAVQGLGGGAGGPTDGSNINELRAQRSEPASTNPDIQREAAQI